MIKAIELAREMWLFLTLVVATLGISVTHVEYVLEYIHVYNLHLVLLTIMGFYIINFSSNRRHKHAENRLDSHQAQLNNMILESSANQLRAEIRQAYKDYHEIPVIDFETTIKHLRALDERRIKLAVNSYTEDMMKTLLSKIKL